MKAKDYRSRVGQLGNLTEVQREALIDALSAKSEADEVVALIETRFPPAPPLHTGRPSPARDAKRCPGSVTRRRSASVSVELRTHLRPGAVVLRLVTTAAEFLLGQYKVNTNAATLAPYPEAGERKGLSSLDFYGAQGVN
jgi:hypothetical protein